MEFDETNKVIIETMNKEQAIVFVLFLRSEISRHYMDIENAEDLIQEVKGRFGI